MKRGEKNQKNNCSRTYIYMYYGTFNFGISPALKRCGGVVRRCCTGWNQHTKVLG